jgi:DNA (cytosine-5)-methyltransferase 1
MMAKKQPKSQSICGLDWILRKKWPPLPRHPEGSLNLVDLFCGCGGLTLGAWEAARANRYRLDIRLAVDFNEDAIAVYRHNFNLDDAVARCTGVHDVVPGELGTEPREAEIRLKRQVGRIDVLVAGPPCQGHSDLNNHTRREDPRNGLYLKVVRAVEVLRPRFVLIENVGAVVHDRGGVVQVTRKHLARLGYAVAHSFLRAEDLGLPQRRRRHILLATKLRGIDLACLFPTAKRPPATLRQYIEDIQDEPESFYDVFRTPAGSTETNRRRIAFLFKNRLYDLPNDQRPPCHSNGHSYKSMYGRLHWDKPAQTITTGFGSMGQGRFVHPARRRLLTPHEAARIQGFPDFFDTSFVKKRTKLLSMIGNLVPPVISGRLLDTFLSSSST